MKDLRTLYRELEDRPDFEITRTTIDGGMGVFTKGPKKKMTVVWSHAAGWEHVSIDGKRRIPDWEEMCELKDMFFKEDECCVQYHPPKSDYVNTAPYCLHIWRPIERYAGKLPMPPKILI